MYFRFLYEILYLLMLYVLRIVMDSVFECFKKDFWFDKEFWFLKYFFRNIKIMYIFLI